MNELKCRSCGAPLRASDIDRRFAIVHCSHCDSVYDLTGVRADADDVDDESAGSLGGARPRTAPASRRARPAAAKPSGVTIERGTRSVRIRWKWYSHGAVFCLCASVSFIVIALLLSDLPSVDEPGDAFVPLLLLSAGAAATYTFLAGVINRTDITADEAALRVRHGPLPFGFALTVDASSIEQFFVSESFAVSRNGERIPGYFVNVVLRNNTVKRVSRRLRVVEHAVYLEQELERALGVRDRSVAGEVLSATVEL